MKIQIDYSNLKNELAELKKLTQKQGYLKEQTFEEWVKDYVENSIYELLEEFGVEYD
jgi:hypothetical protein